MNHLPRISSDYSSLILFHRKSFSLKNIPFKFEEMWLTHPSFLKVVEDSWATPCTGTPQFILAQKLKILKFNLKAWNKGVFGQQKVKNVEAEKTVTDIQIIFYSTPCDPTLSDLNSAKSSLHNWLNVESTH